MESKEVRDLQEKVKIKELELRLKQIEYDEKLIEQIISLKLNLHGMDFQSVLPYIKK